MYLVTTALDIDTSDNGANLSMILEYTPSGLKELSQKENGRLTLYTGSNKTYNETAYVVACSLNATTTVDVLDVQNDVLVSTGLSQFADVDQRSWSVWSPVGSILALGSEVCSPCSSPLGGHLDPRQISSALNNANQVSSVRNLSTSEASAFTNMDV